MDIEIAHYVLGNWFMVDQAFSWEFMGVIDERWITDISEGVTELEWATLYLDESHIS